MWVVEAYRGYQHGDEETSVLYCDASKLEAMRCFEGVIETFDGYLETSNEDGSQYFRIKNGSKDYRGICIYKIDPDHNKKPENLNLFFGIKLED